MNFVELGPPHEDGVNDLSFDYYGKRLASCSADKHIKIWDFDDEARKWRCVDIPRAHNDCVYRVAWGHPEFGQILASCSEDRIVNIWEEQVAAVNEKSESKDKWVKKAQLSDSKKAVVDVKFAPRHLGLKIASASAEGIVRIYEATDVFSLSYWVLQDTIFVENATPSTSTESEHGLTCISWDDCPFEPPKFAVGGYSKRVSVWTADNSSGAASKWRQELILEDAGPANNTPVHDVAWAPTMGRSFHLIATANRSSIVKIHKLRRSDNGALALESTAELKHPGDVRIWRVCWNATATVLSTSAEDGSLDMWKRNFEGTWVIAASVPARAAAVSVY